MVESLTMCANIGDAYDVSNSLNDVVRKL